MFNRHALVQRDPNNVSNKDNAHHYAQILSGVTASPVVDYLLNLGTVRLKDAQSIGMYNGMNLAGMVGEARVLEEILDGREIRLGQPKVKLRDRFVDVVTRRKSVRLFSGRPIMVAELATLLHYSFGVPDRVMHFEDMESPTRYYPSGGALYPLDVFVVVNAIQGVDPGAYRYQPHSGTLYPVTKDFDTGLLLESGDFDTDKFGCAILYGYDINRNYLKYGDLVLLTTFVELGNAAHNFDLVATALDLAVCQIAGFDKPYAQRQLGLDGVNSHIIFAQLCGRV